MGLDGVSLVLVRVPMQENEFRQRSGDGNTGLQARVNSEVIMKWISHQLVIGAYERPHLRLGRKKGEGLWHDTDDIAGLIIEPNRASDHVFLSTENVFPEGVSQNGRASARHVSLGERSAKRRRNSQEGKEAERGLNLMNFLRGSKASHGRIPAYPSHASKSVKALAVIPILLKIVIKIHQLR